MSSRLLLSFFLALFLFACTASEEETPPPIPPEELKEIIAAALILEPAGRELPYSVQDSVYNKYYTKILSEKGYSIDAFISSMQWLQKDPKRLQETYTEVLERIQVIESEVNN